MSERKAVIKNADMSEEMQQDAVDCATQALEKYNIEKVSVNGCVVSRVLRRSHVSANRHDHIKQMKRFACNRFDVTLFLFRQKYSIKSIFVFFLFLLNSFDGNFIGYCRIHQERVRQKIQPDLALYCRKKFRFVCNARDTPLHILLLGTGCHFTI